MLHLYILGAAVKSAENTAPVILQPGRHGLLDAVFGQCAGQGVPKLSVLEYEQGRNAP